PRAAAPWRLPRRLPERGNRSRAGPGGGERRVMSPLPGVLDAPGEPAMERLAADRRQRLVRGSGEEWMREPHSVAVEDEDARSERGLECVRHNAAQLRLAPCSAYRPP